MKQKDRVFNHLKHYGTITSKEASDLYGIMQLPGIIHTLRHRDGLNIGGTMRPVKNRYGKACTVKVYELFPAEEGQYLLC